MGYSVIFGKKEGTTFTQIAQPTEKHFCISMIRMGMAIRILAFMGHLQYTINPVSRKRTQILIFQKNIPSFPKKPENRLPDAH